MFGRNKKPKKPVQSDDGLPSIPESESYKKYKADESYHDYTHYESLCKKLSKLFILKCPNFLKSKIDDAIYMSDMKVTVDEVFTATIMSCIIGSIIATPIISIMGMPIGILALALPLFISFNILTYPPYYSDVVRIRAGNETVDIILYMVIYLSLNPVFEKAVEFAAINCHGPLGGDLKKILWDVEMGRYTTIKEAIGIYSKKWSIWNNEFVESLITLQMVSTQPNQERRRDILDEALNRTLKTTYDKMEKYSKDMKVPSMMILTFGIMMPLMGLIMFPMVSIFMSDSVNPIAIGVCYDVILPGILLWYLNRLISKRPSAFSHSEKTGGIGPRKYLEFKKLKIKLPIKLLAVVFVMLVSLPGILHFVEMYGVKSYYTETYGEYEATEYWKEYCQTSYDNENLISAILQAMFLIWGIAGGVIIFTYLRSAKQYKLEEFIRKTEDDFQVGLFELQVALNQNIPIELAIPNVLEKYERMNKKASPMYVFFNKIYNRISQLSLTFKQALYDEQTGVLRDFPSPLIKNIMNIVSSALSKGPIIVANAAKDIISCLRKTSEIEHMIQNLLESVISNIKTQASFIAPLMGAIIAAVAVLIVEVLQRISKMLDEVAESMGSGAATSISNTMDIINLKDVLPPTVMELIIGVYILESVIIMCIFLTGIERGFDDVYRDYLIATTLTKAMAIYSVVFFLMVILFQPLISSI